MPGTMVEKLQLVVDATTGAAESRFSRLTATARETGDTSVRSASNVEDAANRVALAQLKAQDAVGSLRVAEQRLQDLRDKGNASATQLAAAEEKVAAAERRVHLATREAAAATEAQTASQEEATTQADHGSRAQERLGQTLGNLKGEVVGLVAGTSLVAWLTDSTRGFLEGARGANALAISMNASVEEGGQLAQMFATLGLSADDLLEIQAQFATTGRDGLTAMGTELQHNNDGTVNWARSLTDTLTQLQKVPDATERNRLGFAMFGEEGYKQLSRLLTSGMDVADIMDAIGTPFSPADVRAAQAYDTAMMRLSLTSGNVGRTLARNVIPVVTDLVEAFGTVAGVVTAIPAPLALATAAAVTLGITGISPTAVLGARLAVVMATVRAEVALASATFIEGGAAAGVLGGGLAVAQGAAKGVIGMLGGPLGLALIGSAAVWKLASDGAEAFEEHARDAALAVKDAGGTINDENANIRRQAELLLQNAGAWERAAMAARGAQELSGDDQGLGSIDFAGLNSGLAAAGGLFGDTENAARGAEAGVKDAVQELGAFGAQSELAQQKAKGLNDLIAEGTTSGREFGDAVAAAATSQAAQTRTTDLATAALEAYKAVTTGAVEAVHGLIDAQLAAESADYGYLSALDELNAARDDEKTSVDEVAQAHNAYKVAALAAGDAAADAAVAAATAAGTVLDPLTEANIRADALLENLRAKLNTPGLSEGAQADLAALITQLQTAKENGDVQALVTLTGVDQATGELDQATEDRETTVNVETRGGPAVDEYLGRLTKDRLAIVRVESRNGPAVDSYLDGLAHERLAIIRVETRGGPDVDRYLDNLAGQDRTAVINVRRNGSAPPATPSGAPGVAGLFASGGSVTVQNLAVTVQADSSGRVTAQSAAEGGRQVVQQLTAYTRRNGAGWLRGLQ